MSRQSVSPERFAAAAYDALSANIAILDSRGVIIAVNRAWDDFALAAGGQPSGNGLGSDYLALCDATQGEDRAYAQETAAGIRALLSGERALAETEYPCWVGQERHYFLARVTAFEQDGERFAVVAHEDITRRKEAELSLFELNRSLEARVDERTGALERTRREVERRNAQLEESNRNLSQFASVAAHDLQEPLRLIGAYADLLRHRSGQALDTRAQGYLTQVLDQVARARQLVRDVLSLSRVAVRPNLTRIDLQALWDEAVLSYRWPDDARLECGPLPAVLGDAAQLRQLLLNLLGNALKFRSARPLELHLSARSDAEWITFTLQDNGLGIAPEHHEKVFVMFQRLHSRAYPGPEQASPVQASPVPELANTGGNGVGLAVCKMVVERHGGQLWLTSALGEGAAFHFSLPAAGAPD
ncbi:sensor histidine kinase [Deinococcus sp.]|uniref:sensor histidine kinase n=1 Tax=Deinococcus sp. TaxID=47478 RepID=UPI003CC5814E